MRPEPFEVEWIFRSEDIRRSIEREGERAIQELDDDNEKTKYILSTFCQQDTWEIRNPVNVGEEKR
jgi:hypothetical protein